MTQRDDMTKLLQHARHQVGGQWQIALRVQGAGADARDFKLPGDIDFGEGVIFNPDADLLRIGSGRHLLEIRPGRPLLDRIAAGAVQAEEAAKAALGEEERCPGCGVVIRWVPLESDPERAVPLEAKPDERGIYVLTPQKRTRKLEPFETPTSATYQTHVGHCPQMMLDPTLKEGLKHGGN